MWRWLSWLIVHYAQWEDRTAGMHDYAVLDDGDIRALPPAQLEDGVWVRI